MQSPVPSSPTSENGWTPPRRRRPDQSPDIESGPSTADQQDINARRYQLEVLEVAVSRNTISYLDTGAGKTFIAVLLVRQFLNLFLPDTNGSDEKRKWCIFLAPTVSLVIQQAKVLEGALPLSVDRYYGMRTDVWTQKKDWEGPINDHQILVMTPQIFLNLLRSAFFKVQQIGLLIIDECHHTSGDHPYNCLMREFYKPLDASERPLLFGMTATPIKDLNHKDDLEKMDMKMRVLEMNLCSTIFTPPSREEVEKVVSQPRLITIKFSQPRSTGIIDPNTSQLLPNETEMVSGLEDQNVEHLIKEAYLKFDKIPKHRQFIHAVFRIYVELGNWAAYRAVKLKLEISRAKAKSPLLMVAFGISAEDEQQWLLLFLHELELIGRALARTLGDDLNSPTKCLPDVPESNSSEKVIKILRYLKKHGESRKLCGIIFVQLRLTARVLSDLIVASDMLSGTIAKAFVGLSSAGVTDVRPEPPGPPVSDLPALQPMSSSIKIDKQHREILDSFRVGDTQLLVATSVAEEGIDIRACDLVVHFDSIRSQAVLLQTAGRARHKDARVVVLSELNDLKQQALVSQMQSQKKSTVALAASKKTEELDEELLKQVLYDPNFQLISPITGAIVTLESSIQTLNRYCSNLPRDNYSTCAAYYQVDPLGENEFICSVFMPINAPFDFCVGKIGVSKDIAKRMAALEGCRNLYKIGALDEHFRPVAKAAMILDRFEKVEKLQPNEVKDYPLAPAKVFSTPYVFNSGRTEAYLCTIAITPNARAAAKSRKVATFAGTHFGLIMPHLFNEPIQFTSVISGIQHDVTISKGRAVTLTGREIINISGFWAWLKWLLTEAAAGETEMLAYNTNVEYFAAKQKREHSGINETAGMTAEEELAFSAERAKSTKGILVVPVKKDQGQYVIDWTGITNSLELKSGECVLNLISQLDQKTAEEKLENAVLYSSQNKRSYYLEKIRWDLRPTAEMQPKTNKFVNVAEYYFKKLKMKHKVPPESVDMSQPLIEALPFLTRSKSILTVAEMKAATGDPEESGASGAAQPSPIHLPTYVLPQAVHLFPLNYQALRQAKYLLSILWRVENLCRVVDVHQSALTDFLPLTMENSVQLLEALTLTQTLELISYERLETLGDSVLKFGMIRNLYCQYPNQHEGVLANTKSFFVSNSYLAHLMLSRKENADFVTHLSGEHISKQFVQFGPEESRSLAISNKQLADIAEAITGAIYLRTDEETAIKFLERLGFDELSVWDWEKAMNRDKVSHFINSAADEAIFKVVEHAIGYTFENRFLIPLALTHASFSRDTQNKTQVRNFIGCYQRLELLGDAVLDLLVTRYWLFDQFPNETPQMYTRMRSAAVSNATFAFLAAELGLHTVIFHHSRTLSGDMIAYVQECLEMCKFDLAKSPDLPQRPWPLNFEPYEMQLLAYPKVLSDVFEALVGAIYLDLKGNVKRTWAVVRPLLLRMLHYVATPKTVPTHPVSDLYVWASRNKCHISISITKEKAPNSNESRYRAKALVNGEAVSEILASRQKLAKARVATAALFTVNQRNYQIPGSKAGTTVPLPGDYSVENLQREMEALQIQDTHEDPTPATDELDGDYFDD